MTTKPRDIDRVGAPGTPAPPNISQLHAHDFDPTEAVKEQTAVEEGDEKITQVTPTPGLERKEKAAERLDSTVRLNIGDEYGKEQRESKSEDGKNSRTFKK